jgi:hypothetical protein
VQKDDAEES